MNCEAKDSVDILEERVKALEERIRINERAVLSIFTTLMNYLSTERSRDAVRKLARQFIKDGNSLQKGRGEGR